MTERIRSLRVWCFLLITKDESPLFRRWFEVNELWEVHEGKLKADVKFVLAIKSSLCLSKLLIYKINNSNRISLTSLNDKHYNYQNKYAHLLSIILFIVRLYYVSIYKLT